MPTAAASCTATSSRTTSWWGASARSWSWTGGSRGAKTLRRTTTPRSLAVIYLAMPGRDGIEMVFSGDAEAAMVPVYVAQQYPNLVEVTRTREFPGTAVSASANVPEGVRTAVRDALLKLHEDASAYDILVELGATKFEPADAAQFAGHEKMLSGFFGYRTADKVE